MTLYSPRSLLSDLKSSADVTCARPETGDVGELLSIGITAQRLFFYMTLVCLGLTAISSLLLAFQHLAHYAKPMEQRQQIRIIMLPVVYTLLALLSIAFYDASIYIKPLNQVYEAICVTGLFLLFIEYACPQTSMRLGYFENMNITDKRGDRIPNGGLKWFNRTWIVVFQFPITKTLSTIVEIATQAANVYCVNSLSPRYAHLWLQLIDIFIIGGALSAVLKFYRQCRSDFKKSDKAFAKLITFKGIVIFQFLQEILFGFLNGKVFKPTSTLTYNDIYYGVPEVLTALEALIFSIAFHWSFSYSEYAAALTDSTSHITAFTALLDALSPQDIIASIWIAIKGGPLASVIKYSSSLQSPQSSSQEELRLM